MPEEGTKIAAPSMPLTAAPDLDKIADWLCAWVDLVSVNTTTFQAGPSFTSALKTEIHNARESASGLFDDMDDWYAATAAAMASALGSALTESERNLCNLVTQLAGFILGYYKSTDKTAAMDNLTEFLNGIAKDIRGLGQGIVDTTKNAADAANSPLGKVAGVGLAGLLVWFGLKRIGVIK